MNMSLLKAWQKQRTPLKMVNLILDSYSFDPEKLKLSIEKADLYEIIEDCKEQLKPLLAEKILSL